MSRRSADFPDEVEEKKLEDPNLYFDNSNSNRPKLDALIPNITILNKDGDIDLSSGEEDVMDKIPDPDEQPIEKIIVDVSRGKNTISTISNPTLAAFGYEHISGEDACKHCLQLNTRHQLNDSAFPIDPTDFNSMNQAITQMVKNGNKVFEEASAILEEIKKEQDRDSPVIAEVKQMIDSFKSWGKLGLGLASLLASGLIALYQIFS